MHPLHPMSTTMFNHLSKRDDFCSILRLMATRRCGQAIGPVVDIQYFCSVKRNEVMSKNVCTVFLRRYWEETFGPQTIQASFLAHCSMVSLSNCQLRRQFPVLSNLKCQRFAIATKTVVPCLAYTFACQQRTAYKPSNLKTKPSMFLTQSNIRDFSGIYMYIYIYIYVYITLLLEGCFEKYVSLLNCLVIRRTLRRPLCSPIYPYAPTWADSENWHYFIKRCTRSS